MQVSKLVSISKVKGAAQDTPCLRKHDGYQDYWPHRRQGFTAWIYHVLTAVRISFILTWVQLWSSRQHKARGGKYIISFIRVWEVFWIVYTVKQSKEPILGLTTADDIVTFVEWREQVDAIKRGGDILFKVCSRGDTERWWEWEEPEREPGREPEREMGQKGKRWKELKMFKFILWGTLRIGWAMNTL